MRETHWTLTPNTQDHSSNDLMKKKRSLIEYEKLPTCIKMIKLYII